MITRNKKYETETIERLLAFAGDQPIDYRHRAEGVASKGVAELGDLDLSEGVIQNQGNTMLLAFDPDEIADRYRHKQALLTEPSATVELHTKTGNAERS
jgi:hypothetical protein